MTNRVTLAVEPTGEEISAVVTIHSRKLVNDACQIHWDGQVTFSDGGAKDVGAYGSQMSEAAMHWDLGLLARELVKDALR